MGPALSPPKSGFGTWALSPKASCFLGHRLPAVQIPEFIHTQQALSGDRVKTAKRETWNKSG